MRLVIDQGTMNQRSPFKLTELSKFILEDIARSRNVNLIHTLKPSVSQPINRPDSPPLETYCPLSKAATAVSCGMLAHGSTLIREYGMKLINIWAHICVQNFRAELVMKE